MGQLYTTEITMPFKVQINYRYPDEGIVKGDEEIYYSYGELKQNILETMSNIKGNLIQKTCITIEYIPLKKGG